MEEKNTSLSDVALDNIEALAAGEGGTSMWFCRGTGSLDCPSGNKVKYIVDKVAMIHSVDSLRLAETIEKEAEKKDVVVPILIEVNVAQEESKFGLKPEEVLSFIEQIASFPHIQIKGLMTIAPYVENAEENREIFRELKKLSVDIAAKNINNVTMSVLSMGMTGDYMVAVQEGATMVRVGTGIFGARNYAI